MIVDNEGQGVFGKTYGVIAPDGCCNSHAPSHDKFMIQGLLLAAADKQQSTTRKKSNNTNSNFFIFCSQSRKFDYSSLVRRSRRGDCII